MLTLYFISVLIHIKSTWIFLMLIMCIWRYYTFIAPAGTLSKYSPSVQCFFFLFQSHIPRALDPTLPGLERLKGSFLIQKKHNWQKTREISLYWLAACWWSTSPESGVPQRYAFFLEADILLTAARTWEFKRYAHKERKKSLTLLWTNWSGLL